MSKHRKIEVACEVCGTKVIGCALPRRRFCAPCGAKLRLSSRWARDRKYQWTPEREKLLRERYDPRVRNRAAEIGRSIGFPVWQIKRKAGELGLTHPVDRRDWTADEVQFLWENTGTRTAKWMSRRLRRSEASVVLKLKRMRISRRVREGYTLTELQLCFGTDHHVIDRWVANGWLDVQYRDEVGERKSWAVTEREILRFITDHPMDFRLDKVDQMWFMDLVTDGGVLRKALRLSEAHGEADSVELVSQTL